MLWSLRLSQPQLASECVQTLSCVTGSTTCSHQMSLRRRLLDSTATPALDRGCNSRKKAEKALMNATITFLEVYSSVSERKSKH